MNIADPMTTAPPSATTLALCRHFGACGGCKHQDVAYDRQLADKARGLETLFAAYWPHPIPITGSPDIWYYRNKADPTFGHKYYDTPPPKDFKRDTVLGFKAQGRWYSIMDTEECRLVSPEFGPLLESVLRWAKASDLPPFDSRRNAGFLKHLLVREGKRTGERMVVLITREGEFDAAPFVKAVLDAYPATSIQRAPTASLSAVAFAESSEVLHGSETIEERLHLPDGRTLSFRVSPFSFLQTNTKATELLYDGIRNRIREMTPDIVYDFYGGCGGIAFACSPHVERIVSVESVVSATEDGHYNAGVNGIRNVEFATAEVEKFLRTLGDEGGPLPEATVFILDPPRAGLHPKALKRILELRPRRVLYVSCKPSVLARELAAMGEVYDVKEMTAFDLFPHTEHVEALAVLERR